MKQDMRFRIQFRSDRCWSILTWLSLFDRYMRGGRDHKKTSLATIPHLITCHPDVFVVAKQVVYSCCLVSQFMTFFASVVRLLLTHLFILEYTNFATSSVFVTYTCPLLQIETFRLKETRPNLEDGILGHPYRCFHYCSKESVTSFLHWIKGLHGSVLSVF